jgi:hypothetical protein
MFLDFYFEILNHGGNQGNTAKALTRWRHPVAPSEALNVLHWAMRPTLYHRICMVIEITSNFPEISIVVDSVVTQNNS